jgi:TIR domain
MRIHLVGSTPDNDYERSPESIEKNLIEYADFFSAAAELGRVISERGHTIIIGSDFSLTVDYHAVMEGMLPVIKASPMRRFYVEVWRPNDRKRPYESLRHDFSNLNIEYFVSKPGFPIHHRKNPKLNPINTNLWTFAHQSAIANADVLIAMGGTVGTERAVHIAKQSGVTALPLSTFGGGAEQAYQALESNLILLPGGHALSAEWSPFRAEEIIKLAEQTGTHSYFISYSHAQIEWCDLVHLALYTRGRVVLRDRDELAVGRAVQPRLMDAIGKAETFVLLWSKEAAESEWCQKEIDKALELHRQGFPPRRIVMLRKDKTDPPTSLEELLWLESYDRRQTDDAINRIVAEESY